MWLRTLGIVACRVALGVVLISAPFGRIAKAQPAELNSANVVIMVDLTGSTSDQDLERERAAARNLLQTFQQLSAPPRVAIGSFNVPDPTAVGPTNSARIVDGGALTSSYGDLATATGLYGVINRLPAPDGFTDISAAITAAQLHLESQGGTGARFILLISDGTSNRPGSDVYSSCEPCGCPNAQAAFEKAAEDAKAKGTTIFAVHFEGSRVNIVCPNEPAAGLAIMKDKIASSTATFFQGTQDLSGVFSQVSCSVKCDDSDPCTVDSCNATSGACEHAPATSDRDSDGILDCRDSCRGNDALLGTACTPTGGCSTVGQYVCGGDGAVTCVDRSANTAACYNCTKKSVTTSLARIKLARKTALNAFTQAVKDLGTLKRGNKASQQYAKLALKQVQRRYRNASSVVARIPVTYLQCADTVRCTTVFKRQTYDSVLNELTFYRSMTKSVLGKIKGINGAVSWNQRKLQAVVERAKATARRTFAGMPQSYQECQ